MPTNSPLLSGSTRFIHSPIVPIAGAAVAGLLVYYAGSRSGLGITYDSVNYLHAGYTLATQGELLRPSGQPFVEWTPLYPVLIAGLYAIWGNLTQPVLIFQALTAGCVVWITSRWMRRFFHEPLLFLAALLALAFATPLLLVHHFAWSESFFVLLLSMYAQVLLWYGQQPDKRTFFLLVLLGALIGLQRNAGLFFIMSGVLILWQFPKPMAWQRRLGNGGLLGFLSVIPLFIWWMRNYQLAGRVMAGPTGIPKTFLTHWTEINDVLTGWFLPNEIPLSLRMLLVYGLVAGALLYWWQHKKPLVIPQVAVPAWLFGGYFVCFHFTGRIADVADDRYLAPVYIFGVVLFFALLDQLSGLLSQRMNVWLLAGCLLWTVYPVSRSIANVYFWRQQLPQLPKNQPVSPEFWQKIVNK